MKVLNFFSKSYSLSTTECDCVTGGGGCSCDDGTSEYPKKYKFIF